MLPVLCTLWFSFHTEQAYLTKQAKFFYFFHFLTCGELNLCRDKVEKSTSLQALEETLTGSWGGQARQLPLSVFASLQTGCSWHTQHQ